MAERIKGITVVLGGDATGLNKALAGTNKEIKDTQAQLRDVERLLKLDPTNTNLLEQRQRLLADAVSETKNKLDTLKEAEKKVQEQFKRGEVSQRQYDGLQREIAATAIQLKKAESEANAAANAMKGVDERPMEEVAEAAKSAEKALDKAGKEASDFGDYLKAGAIIEGVKGIASTIGSVSDETKEFRKVMGTLEVSSAAAGYTAEQTSEAYYQLYWAIGDEQATATAIANLQALNLEQKDLYKMLDLSVGAWATYGDSIPIDGLAESINETIRSGTVTGTFADVLNWGSKEGETFGVMLKENTEANKEWNEAVSEAKTAEDFFNLALQGASSEAERANIVMQAMANQGLSDTADAWYQNNKDILVANDAQLSFMESASEMSERVAPAIIAVKDGGNQLLQTFLDITKDVDFDAIANTINNVFDAVSDLIKFVVDNKEPIISALLGIAAGLVALKLASLISTLSGIASGATTAAAAFPALASAIGMLANPVFLITAVVVAFVALIAVKGEEILAILESVDDWLQSVFLTDWTTLFGPVLGNVLNGFFANVKNIWDAIKQIFEGIINFIRGVFTGDWQRAWQGVQDIFGGIFEGMVALVKAPINAIIGLLNGAIDGINKMIDGLNEISFDIPDWVPGLGGKSFGLDIPNIGKIPYLAKGGILSSGSAIVGEAGPELLTVAGGRAVVQPLTGSSPNKAGISITMNNTFNGYTPATGEEVSRDLVRAVNRALGRAY